MRASDPCLLRVKQGVPEACEKGRQGDMTYSIIGILAIIILAIINKDVLWNSERTCAQTPALRYYRLFLLCVLAYCSTDAAWGLLGQYGMTTALFFDTSVYFLAMAALVLFWTRYVAAYLEERNLFFPTQAHSSSSAKRQPWRSTASIPSSSGSTKQAATTRS